MTFLPPAIWMLVFAALAAALIFACRSIKGSGDRRCPHCWYDLSRVRGRRCPECDFTDVSVESLYPTRRRWDRIAIALALITIPTFAVYESVWLDAVGEALLKVLRWVLWPMGMAVMGLAGYDLGRTMLAAVRAARSERPMPFMWTWRTLAMILVMLHGYAVTLLPTARVFRWGVVPGVIRELIEAVARRVGLW